MKRGQIEREKVRGGVVHWLVEKLQRATGNSGRIAVLERIALSPRQSLALVRVEERNFLVATCQEGNIEIEPILGGRIPLERWVSPAKTRSEARVIEESAC